MKKTLLLMALFMVSILSAQNTIATADPVDGTEDLNVTSDIGTITYSGLTPTCETAYRDIFYSHDVSVGDNKLTLGLVVSPNAGIPNTTVRLQILRAVNGDTSTGLQEVSCVSFSINNAGGSFSDTIEVGILDTDDYYMRLYLPNGISSPELGLIADHTSITMNSEFDATLSDSDLIANGFQYSVKRNSIEISNAQNFKDIYVFDISGKKVLDIKNDQSERSIDISALRNGVYIMNLIGNSAQNKSVKFLKK